jgi:hypothetical protein
VRALRCLQRPQHRAGQGLEVAASRPTMGERTPGEVANFAAWWAARGSVPHHGAENMRHWRWCTRVETDEPVL